MLTRQQRTSVRRDQRAARIRNAGAIPTSLVRVAPLPRRRRRNRRSVNSPTGPNSPFLRSYINTMLDPFEYGPVRLGFDCFTASDLATGYLRAAFVVNADGSFAIFLLPSITGMVLTNNGGQGAVGSINWTAASAANSTGIRNVAISARVVSGGLRAFALFPTTSAPGALFVGQLADYSANTLYAESPSGLSNLQDAMLGVGSLGASGTVRPQDPSSFIFSTWPLQGYTGVPSQPVFSTVPFIAGLGFPAGTVIYYEAILNLEILPNYTTASTLAMSADTQYNQDTFSSASSLFNAARRLLTNPSIVDAVGGLAQAVTTGFIDSVQRRFGLGSHALRTRSSRQFREPDRFMVEEL